MRVENPSGNPTKQKLIDLSKLTTEQRIRALPDDAQRAIRRISERENMSLEAARQTYHRRSLGYNH